ncbi:MAG: hypothetical protein R2729_31520 [Bryobacteraceae bacterium]
MTNRDRFAALIGKLLKRTRDGSLTWRETADEEEFLAPTPNASVLISQRFGRFGTELRIKILDDRGRVVETMDASENSGCEEEATELYEAARRTALNSERVLDELLQSLD